MRSKKRNTNINILREQIKNLEVSDKKADKAEEVPIIKNPKELMGATPRIKLKGKGRIKDQLINTSRLLTFDG